MLSRDVTAWPYGGDVPPPPPPLHTDPEQEADGAGMPAASRLEGQQDTLALSGPVGAGDQGYMGRDVYGDGPAVPEARGMFARLHEGSD